MCAPGACAPGAVDTVACGNCNTGTKSRTCTGSCTWGAYGGCSGGGTCSPGATMGGCDPCGEEVCQSDCKWGACQPLAGKQCLYKAGKDYKCCGSEEWQFCDEATCDWFPCAGCSGCGCQ